MMKLKHAAIVLALILSNGMAVAQADPAQVIVNTGSRTETVSRSALVGAQVYDSSGDHVGEIQDVRTGPKGRLQGAQLSVGGFFGIGQSHVALRAADLDVVPRGDSQVVVYVPMTASQLLDMAGKRN